MHLSIVTSVYNGADFLAETIESVLAQTYEHFEFILVDDGSTDDSLAIMQAYASKDQRIRVLTPGKLGLCNALNAGIEAARYDWIVRLDADDICLPNRFARQVEAIRQLPHAAVIGSYVNHINRDGKVLSEWNFGPASVEEYQQWMADGVIPQVIHSSAVLNRKYVEEIGGYDQQFVGCEDYDIFDRLSDYGPVVAVPETLVYYRVHNSSVTANNYFIQQNINKYVLARRHARNEGRELDYATYMAEKSRRPLIQRTREHLDYLRSYYYRKGAIAYAEGSYLHLVMFLGMATLLNPQAVLSRVWQQVIGPRFKRIFSRPAAAETDTQQPATVTESDHTKDTIPNRSTLMLHRDITHSKQPKLSQ